LRRALGRRAPGVPSSRIRNSIAFSLSPGLARRPNELQTDYWARRNSAFARAVASRGFGDADAAYAFNGAALEIFEAAKRKGLRCILDQTAAPWRYNTALLTEETRRWPGWERVPAEIDASGALSAREEAEWRLADMIICGSHFAANALKASGGPREKCIVVPYAGHMPTPPPEATAEKDSSKGRKLRALTIGSVQLRKGAPYLLEAARALSDIAEFRWVGDNLLSTEATRAMAPYVELAGSVPRSEIWRHYAWADVFVLPTLSEGAANVVFEANALGLPVITTKNAGALEQGGQCVAHIPAQDGAALCAAIGGMIKEPPAVPTLPRSPPMQSFTSYSAQLSASVMTHPQ
jgi:glycosyltransferase involved in cell wall biosynthesis